MTVSPMRPALAAALSVFALAPFAAGQQTQPYRYLTIDYQKPAAGKTAEYVALEHNVWRPVHQDRVRKGTIDSWKLYQVMYPNGAGQEYDFITITEFPSFAAMESPYRGTDIKAVLGDARYDEMLTSTPKLRTMVRQDVFAILLSTGTWARADNRILQVVFLKPLEGKAADLQRVQRELFLPLNEDVVKAGTAAGWANLGLRYPYVHEHPYGYASFNSYSSYGQMDMRMPKELSEKWAPKMKELYPLLESSRKRVRGELWVRVDQTEPK